MDLLEAIEHAKLVAEGCASDNRDCAYQHDALAEWLQELKCYRDTGLKPEEIVRVSKKIDDVFRLTEQIDLKKLEHIKDLADAENEGRLVILDEPLRPLVWGDDAHDTILCPRCLNDLMVGFELAPSSETQMFQCPYCGCPVDSTKADSTLETEV